MKTIEMFQRKASYVPALGLVLLGVVLAAGCSFPVVQTGFLTRYQPATRLKGYNIELMRSQRFEGPSTPSVIAIRVVHWLNPIRPESRDLVDLTEQSLQDNLYRGLLLTHPSPTIVTKEEDLDLYLRRRERVLQLEAAVTEIETGVGWLRYFIGFYAGAAEAQMEFRLRDAKTDRLLATFATRRVHAGDSNMGLNFKSWSNRHCLEELTQQAAFDAARLIRDILKANDPTQTLRPPRTLDELLWRKFQNWRKQRAEKRP